MIRGALKYKLKIDAAFNEQVPLKGVFIAVIHATRIPPHIGIIADEKYHSLTIKGQDINTPLKAIIKNSTLRKIPTLLIKLRSHPVFSDVYLSEHFITNVQQFNRVDIGIATCLSPLKLFFEEVYDIPMKDINYLFELLPLLESKGMIEAVFSLNVDENDYFLPIYTNKEINAGIKQVRNEYYS
ncbi:MAG: hypothetical protein NTX97_05515 [Bacteroidetes bacterium]|nr:hypothetical protein [Bacteroidota bacterium]